MPCSRTKFNNVWLSAIDSNGQKLSSWCRKGLDDFHMYCWFCDSGKSQILQHSKKAKHLQAVKPSIDESQGKLFIQSQPGASVSSRSDLHLPEQRRSLSRQLSIINYKNASLQAEVIWLAKLALCNFSFSLMILGIHLKLCFLTACLHQVFQLAEPMHPMLLGKAWVPTLCR